MNHRSTFTRRSAVKSLAAGAASLALPVLAQAGPVRIGYAIARTGPWTGGAQVSQESNYLLWAEQQNAAGGLNVKGSKRPIELVSYDDRSEVETCVRTYEKLMGKNPAKFVGPENPVERVRWSEAALFCNMRSTREGFKPCYDPKTLECDFSADGYETKKVSVSLPAEAARLKPVTVPL